MNSTPVRRRGTPDIDTSDLTGKTAVVTGAGSGIGRSIAKLLGQRGAVVHVADLDSSSAEAVAGQVCTAGGDAVAHAVDVADAEAMTRLADRIFQGGPVDLLFNNAGIGHAGAVVDTTLADWHRLIDVNLMGVVHGLHAFLPRLLAQEGPTHIVNTASSACRATTSGEVPRSAYSLVVAAWRSTHSPRMVDVATMAVLMTPGQSTETLTSVPASSPSSASLSATTAALVAE